ncbi:hypothetical protein PMAYCL1PPCAC_04657, partial [Pristionchus mayeri]
GVWECDAALDRCVIFDSMWIADYMKLDAAKDTKMADYVNETVDSFLTTGKVYGKACMSQRDCDTLKLKKADVCISAEGAGECYCTTDKCTGSG